MAVGARRRRLWPYGRASERARHASHSPSPSPSPNPTPNLSPTPNRNPNPNQVSERAMPPSPTPPSVVDALVAAAMEAVPALGGSSVVSTYAQPLTLSLSLSLSLTLTLTSSLPPNPNPSKVRWASARQ